jgi:hypothetical protein
MDMFVDVQPLCSSKSHGSVGSKEVHSGHSDCGLFRRYGNIVGSSLDHRKSGIGSEVVNALTVRVCVVGMGLHALCDGRFAQMVLYVLIPVVMSRVLFMDGMVITGGDGMCR